MEAPQRVYDALDARNYKTALKLCEKNAKKNPVLAALRCLTLQRMRRLSEAAEACNEILVESGPRLVGAFLQAGLLDELIVYMAPALLGDRARPLLALPIDSMANKVALNLEDVRKVGVDWRFTALPDYSAAH